MAKMASLNQEKRYLNMTYRQIKDWMENYEIWDLTSSKRYSNNILEKFTTAVGYLEFYDCADVLCLDRKYIPPQLSDISFTSDLSGLVDVR